MVRWIFSEFVSVFFDCDKGKNEIRSYISREIEYNPFYRVCKVEV